MSQEMVWNIVNNLDFKTAKAVTLDERVNNSCLKILSKMDNVGLFYVTRAGLGDTRTSSCHFCERVE